MRMSEGTLLHMIGAGESNEATDTTKREGEYLAEAYESTDPTGS